MKLVIIFGPPAVGKMTVGQALAKGTGFGLFHNHLTIEPLIKIFPYGSPQFCHLNELFRNEIFDQAAGSDLPGFIITFVWDLDDPEDREAADQYVSHFKKRNAEIYYVELASSQAERLRRNRTENRLNEKASKRDLEFSERNLLKLEAFSFKRFSVRFLRNRSA